ncbi:MAG: Polyketide biosynthesis cytochrome PksS [Candidatus Binatus sp.]|nr:Polyketide biosynthesis cytochrome PksS [Candidatus Binatus sp.]
MATAALSAGFSSRSEFVFDPLDEATRRDPFPWYARARAEFPIYEHRGLPLISFFRHADIVRIFADPESWSSDFSLLIQPYLAINPELADELPPFFATTDGEQHRRLRSLVNKAFTPKMVQALQQSMSEMADALIDTALATGEVDLIGALTAPFPIRVIGQMIGVPPEDAPQFQRWSRELTESQVQGILKPPDPTFVARQLETTRKMHSYFGELARQRTLEPKSDLISALAAAESEGNRLSLPELMQMLTILLIAGNATTTAMLSNIVVELIAHPEQLEILRANHDLIPSAVQEVLRFSSPVQAMPRLSLKPVRFGESTIKPGQFILLWIGSANRDEDVFERADDFDITRRPNQHIAFGFGTHSCIGAHLAFVEGCIVLRKLIEKTRSFKMINLEPLPMHSSFVARSYRSLPVRLIPN